MESMAPPQQVPPQVHQQPMQQIILTDENGSPVTVFHAVMNKQQHQHAEHQVNKDLKYVNI